MFGTAGAADWITAPSYFTHDPQSGERVQQYSPIGPFYTYTRGDFTRSGYRNTRSSIQVGTSADNYIVTEQWGKPIQPFGQQRFPYRPYSVPYNAWGPMFPGRGGFGFGGGFGFRGGFGFPVPFAGGAAGAGPGVGPAPGAFPSQLGGSNLQDQLQPGFNSRQQLLDGRYPPFDELDPFERKQVFDNFYPRTPPPPVQGNPLLDP